MKRRAYTLAEVLIALGIVGILAAVMLPMINKYKPDTTKVLYLNTYDALAESISDMASNGSYYVKDNGVFLFNQHPFANLDNYQDSTNDRHTIAGGRGKFCRVLAENFNTIEEANEVRCSNNNANRPNTNFGANDVSFTNKNGVEFWVATNSSAANTNGWRNADINRYETYIVIDVNGSNNGDNCVFSNNCPKPDRFTFKVSADAEFLPMDEMGIRYLETRSNLKYKKIEDYAANTQLERDIRDRVNKGNRAFDTFPLTDSLLRDSAPQAPGFNYNPYESWLEHEKNLGSGAIHKVQ